MMYVLDIKRVFKLFSLTTIFVTSIVSYQEPIQKTGRVIACCPFHWIVASIRNPHKHTITKIPDGLWDEVASVLTKEKPGNTVGRPIVPFRKVMDGVMCILMTGCQWKMRPSEFGSGSTCHRRFQQWNRIDVFKNMWTGLLENI